ncbi:MAG: FAD/NAD(P)-binding protein [Bacteroidia bacterium]
MNSAHHLLIVGGGASGALLALHLLKTDAAKNWTVTLAERNGEFGPGLAYGSHNKAHHLLNVRAKQLSCFADMPDDFCNYLREIGSNAGADDFVPRSTFGSYVKDCLLKTAANAGARLVFLHDEISSAKASDTAAGYICKTKSGIQINCSHLVLACGNLFPAAPAAATTDVLLHAAYEANPWNYKAFDGLKSDENIVLIGSGLTMSDLVAELTSRGHSGKILSVSPHGFMPAQHQSPQPVWPGFGDELLAAKTLDAQLRIFRKQLQAAAEKNIGWTAVTDSMRPWQQQLWLEANDQWRSDFMQHVRHIWGVARHRLPPATADLLYAAIGSGQLSVEAGRIKTLVPEGSKINVSWMPRGTDKLQTITAAKVINCTGPSSKWFTEGNTLVKQMAADSCIAYDRSGLGLNALPTGELLNAKGETQTNLFAVGPMIRGVLWEITAIPEIRAQVTALAAKLSQQTV